MKSIAFLLPSLEWGGLQRVAVNLLKGLAMRGIRLDVVLATAEGPYLSELPSGVRIIDLKTPIQPRFKSAIKVTWPLVRYLQKEKPDILVSHLYTYNVVAMVARVIARIPAYLVAVEHISLYETKNKPKGIQDQLLTLLRNWLYPRTDVLVAVSQGLAREFEADLNLKPGAIKTIYNPVIDESLLLKAKAPVEHPWFKERELPVVLGVGRLVKQKDFFTLIRAFAQVRRVQPARLVILGEGSQKCKLMALAQELNIEKDVAILDFVDNPYAYMAQTAVFVLSSRQEALPTVLIEALAVGTPVVATNCKSGPEEILDNGKYGWLVPVGDIDAMTEAILKVLSGNSQSVDSAWLEQFALETATQTYLDVMGIAEEYD